MTTNVVASELSYTKDAESYDKDILDSIPHYRELQQLIAQEAGEALPKDRQPRVLDLGIGTGTTSAAILKDHSDIDLVGVDFSEAMLRIAKSRLESAKGSKSIVRLINCDYAMICMSELGPFDCIVSAISIHHQDDLLKGKQRVFEKVFAALRPGGAFILGDLMSYEDPYAASAAEARHFHHMVECMKDTPDRLAKWAHHHLHLNCVTPAETQMRWLSDAGFQTVRMAMHVLNTGLIVAKKAYT